MNIEVLLLIEKHTGTLIEQTNIHLRELLEFRMNKQKQTFFNPPINLVEERKWFLALTSFEATNLVFNKTHENNSFSISTPGHWNSEDAEEIKKNLNKLLELGSRKDIGNHINEVRRRGNQIILGDKKYKVSDLNTRKIEIIEELKRVKCRDLEEMVHRLQLTYNGIVDILLLNILLDHL